LFIGGNNKKPTVVGLGFFGSSPAAGRASFYFFATDSE
jgi:hypothetical protein